MENKKNLKKTLIIATSIIVVLVAGYFISKQLRPASAWYNANWIYRKPITVSNPGTTLTNEDVAFTLDTAALVSGGKMQSDCDDIRVVDNDDSTLLTYRVEGGCNTTSTAIWATIPSLPNGGKTIYIYYGNPSAVNGEQTWTGNFTVLSTASCTGNWTRDTTMDSKFIRGNSSYGGTGGVSSHTHTVTPSVVNADVSLAFANQGCSVNVTSGAHGHGSSASSNTSTNNLPQYRDMIFCKNNRLDLTTSTVGLFDVASQTGWTQYSSLNGRFPRGAASVANGGYASHSHSFTFTINTAGGGCFASCPSSGCTGMPSDGHNHTYGPESVTGTNTPPYLNVVYFQKDSAGTLSSEKPIFLLDTTSMPLGWSRFTALDSKFPQGSTSYGGSSTTSTHSHNGSGGTSGNSGTESVYAGSDVWGMTGHTHGISYTSSSVDHTPPYVDVIFAQRKTSQSASVGAEQMGVPIAPTIGTPTVLSTTSIRWNFTDNSSDEQGFKVYDDTNTLKVTCASPNLTYCDETGLSANTSYTRKVVAYNANGNSDYSATATKYTWANVPTISVTNRTVSTIELTASNIANITSGTSGLYFDCTGGSCDTGINAWVQTATDTATSLSTNTQYTFQVKARNGDSVETSYSSTQSGYTAAAVPLVPALSSVAETSIKVTLNSDQNGNPASTQFAIHDSKTDKFVNISTGALQASADWGTYTQWGDTSGKTVTGLTPNTQYTFEVKARNGDSVETTYSTSVSKYTLANVPLVPILSANSFISILVRLNSDQNNNPSTTVYAIHESVNDKFVSITTGLLQGTTDWGTYAQWGGASGILVTQLSNGTYTFEVKAKNAEDVETAYGTSASVILTPPPSGCYAVKSLTADSVTIYWRDNTSNEDGFLVQKSVDSGTFSDIHTTLPNVLQYEDTSAPSNHTYQYKIIPMKGGLQGPPCTTIPLSFLNGGIQIF